MSILDNKVIKKKKVDKETNLRVMKNGALHRILVEFSSESSKMVVQKSFQDTHQGRKEAEEFQNVIKSTADLKAYFGVKQCSTPTN